ncbi:MAG: asparagine synthase (glutamine-hydrolyzing) [Candidatus Binatia bacterium]
MCGIAGIFALDARPIPEGALAPMNAAMIHRGPDEEGFFSDGVAGLAMRRLSIIGLGNGRQPIFNEDGSIAIVMNGEIYNYRDLKAQLERQGHTFKTGSDVEVAVHLYEERGPDFVNELRGMFAYALYDSRRRSLFLGRDRAGKKPLYYAVHNGRLVFASEIKALHASGLLAKELDPHALESYLAQGFVVGERTLFAHVRKLAAGCMLKATRAGIEVERYWDLPMPQATVVRFEDAAVRVRELLEEAVRIRLMSEVPLGAFLSGGVDSSAVVSIMSRQLGTPVETFAVGFDHPEFDELVYARTAAALYGTHHHELVIRGCSPELLREINWYHDEPAADPATVPTFCLARFSRQHVTVALTGEGGDELFAGYRHYRLHRRLAQLERRVPGVPAFASLLAQLEPHAAGLGPRRLWKGVWIANLPPAERPRGLVSVFTDAEIERLVAREFRHRNGNGYHAAEFRRLQERARDVDCVAQSMYVDAKSQLADQLLMKVDKATMAASLEARCPFLDQRLIEYVAALPTEMKISGAGAKLLLRQALRGLVPDALLDRPKHGFEVPIRRWLLADLAPLVTQLLVTPGAPVHRYLDPQFVQTCWKRLQERDDHQLARQLWTLLNFAVWHDQHWPETTGTTTHVGASPDR